MASFFRATTTEFLDLSDAVVLDGLTKGLMSAGFDLVPDQRIAWEDELRGLRACFENLKNEIPESGRWTLLLEYPIKGRSKRIDCVLLTPKGIVVIEFKASASANSAACWQVQEYCWNLRDFHKASRGSLIAPILCLANRASPLDEDDLNFNDKSGLILDLQKCAFESLDTAIKRAVEAFNVRPGPHVKATEWEDSPIEPTPSVIEFAQSIFDNHEIREISHSHSDSTDICLHSLRSAIEEARREGKRIICFVTGVPGAGKTLVGLHAAYKPEMVDAVGGPVCFASGNRPLIEVLTTALSRNRRRRGRAQREASYGITAPIRDVHDLVRDSLSGDSVTVPPFNAIVFDEAQRVWNAEKLISGLRTRLMRGQTTQVKIDRLLSHGKSEPDLILSLMEHCPSWCALIALVGGGQEIHDGEAGIEEWGRALARRKEQWSVYASDEILTGGVASSGQRLFAEGSTKGNKVFSTPELHLAVSKRAHRAEHFAEWVNHVLEGDVSSARRVSNNLKEFPVWVVRDISLAKRIVRSLSEDARSGVLASSGAIRLRAHGIELSQQFRSGIKYPDWFLRPQGDIRSSSQLEVAATEFECQGLELDWCCVCWGGDFLWQPEERRWEFRRLSSPGGVAPRWGFQNDRATNEFVRNKYRVLLTRAREGLAIFIPQDNFEEDTRDPHLFNATADYFYECGAQAWIES